MHCSMQFVHCIVPHLAHHELESEFIIIISISSIIIIIIIIVVVINIVPCMNPQPSS